MLLSAKSSVARTPLLRFLQTAKRASPPKSSPRLQVRAAFMSSCQICTRVNPVSHIRVISSLPFSNISFPVVSFSELKRPLAPRPDRVPCRVPRRRSPPVALWPKVVTLNLPPLPPPHTRRCPPCHQGPGDCKENTCSNPLLCFIKRN